MQAKSKPLFARSSLVYELLLGNLLNVFRHFNCILYHGRREDKKKIWVHFVWTQVKRLPSRFVERNTKVHQISSGAQCNLTVVSYQNESFPSKWELPCLPPSSIELWRRERESMQLSLWWKTLILIGHYDTIQKIFMMNCKFLCIELFGTTYMRICSWIYQVTQQRAFLHLYESFFEKLIVGTQENAG